MNQKLKEGREWATERFREHARKANVPIDDASWHDIVNEDASNFEVKSRGKKECYRIENLDLEDKQRRSSLDQIMESIVNEFS